MDAPQMCAAGRPRAPIRCGRAYPRGGDPAAPTKDLLADPDSRARGRPWLALVADEGQPAVEELARLVASPGHEGVADRLERLGIREACHGPVGAARELLEEVDAAQAAEDGHAIGEEPAQSLDLGQGWRFLQLHGLDARNLTAQSRQERRGHRHLRGHRLVLEDERNTRSIGHREVVVRDHVEVLESGRRGDHERIRAVLLGHARERGGEMRPGGGDTHRHRYAPAHLLDHALHHAPALLVGESMRLARDAEHGYTGDARGRRRLHEAGEAGGIEVTAVRERRGHDVKDAGPGDHPAPDSFTS